MGDNIKPKIFISHSWEDNEIAKRLAENLRRDGAEIWVEFSKLKAGDSYIERMNKVLEWCDTFVLLWSESAAKSEWVKIEWQRAIYLDKKIIPLILEDTKLPAILRASLHIDFIKFNKGYEQLRDILDLASKEELEKKTKEKQNAELKKKEIWKDDQYIQEERWEPTVWRQNKDDKPPLEKGRKKSNKDWSLKINKEIIKLTFGQVLFNIPKLMKTGKKERIEVRISKDLNTDITKKLKGKGTPEIEISKVGEFMKVRLSGDHFKINELNEEEQIVAEDTYTEWAWDVVPLKSKIQVLHFHVTIRLKIEGTEEKRDYPVIDKEVYVKVSPVYSTKTFVVNNWKWILTALLLPLAGWIVRMVLMGGK